MIDRELIEEMSYQDFAPVFRDMERVFQKLDALEIRSIVGDRPVDLLEDKFIRLVLATFRVLESPNGCTEEAMGRLTSFMAPPDSK